MHRRHSTPTLALILFCVTLVLSAAFAPSAAHAIGTGSGGWYWPVGTEDFHGWDGWWVFRAGNHSWHMAQDMPTAVGHAVYAIGDGTIIESKPDSGYGGVFVVMHKTGCGEYFKAVYGHIYRGSGLGVGSKVKAGQVIGRVNSARHLHFGVHPGKAYPPDNNPFRGHTYTSSNTYGWTDAVKYLKTHPRVLIYKAPPLPAIGTFDTTSSPTVLGVSAGKAYWTIRTDEEPVMFRQALDRESDPEPADEPEEIDTTSYPAVASTSTFTVFDARPTLTLERSTKTPEWSRAVRLSGTLANAIGRPFIGARLVVERSVDGGPWSRIATVTAGLTGSYSMSFVPQRRQVVRARFVAPSLYVPAASSCVTIAPRPAVSAPSFPPYIVAGRSFTVRGTLSPRHAAGPGATILRLQRRSEGVWSDVATATTTYADMSGGSSYSARLKLRAGSWRARSETPADDHHASKTTCWVAFTVR